MSWTSPRWNAARSVQDLLPELPESLKPWQPQLRYLLIDEGSYNEQDLAQLENAVAALIRMENSPLPESLARVIGNLLLWLQQDEQAELNRDIAQWLRQVLLPAKLPGQTLPQMRDLTEAQSMLAERVKDWTHQWKEEGKEEGLQEGLQKGLQEGIQKGKAEGKQEGLQEGLQKGEAQVLGRLLAKRFGPLPDWATARIAAADSARLETWAEGIFEATSLEALLGPRD